MNRSLYCAVGFNGAESFQSPTWKLVHGCQYDKTCKDPAGGLTRLQSMSEYRSPWVSWATLLVASCALGCSASSANTVGTGGANLPSGGASNYGGSSNGGVSTSGSS